MHYKIHLMKQLIFITILIFIGIVEVFSQSDFRKGYIVKNSGDTLYGLIDYKGNKASVKKCIHKRDINSEKKTFTPDEIISYRFIDSKNYISKSVNSKNNTKQLFLEYLINGIVDIYYYRDNLGEHYLIDDGNEILHELRNEEKEVTINNKRYFKESKEYIRSLKYIFRESSKITKEVDYVNLNHKSLIKITHDYHNEICSDEECIIYQKKLPKIKKKYGVLIGLNIISISEIVDFPNDYYYLRNSEFGVDISPSIGLYYKVNLPFINERLYFQYEGVYTRMNVKTSNSYIEPDYNMTYLNDITLTQNIFNNFALIKYEFPKGKFRPTFQIGIFTKYFFKTDYNRNLEVITSSGLIYDTYQTNENPFDLIDYGLTFGIGFKVNVWNSKEIFFDCRYQRGFGLLPAFNTNTYSIKVGYQISK